MSRRPGFTLIEVLTSVTIGLALSVLATSTFFELRTTMRRTQARLEMHNTARYIFQALSADLAAMQQDSALYIETKAPAGANGGEVALTFLRGKLDNFDFSKYNANAILAAPGHWDEYNAGYQSSNSSLTSALTTDLVWTQWRWDGKSQAISTGSSSRVREWQSTGPWAGGGHDFGINAAGNPHLFRALPQPQRVAGPDAKSTLDLNRFGSPEPADIGDYQDLINNVRPVTRGVSDLRFEFVLDDLTIVKADGASTQTIALDGDFVDGHVPTAAAKPHLKRPRLIRVRFDVTDPSVKLTQTFSFSFQAPGALPPLP